MERHLPRNRGTETRFSSLSSLARIGWALIVDQGGESAHGVVEAKSSVLFKNSSRIPAVESLNEGVLDPLARRDEVPADSVVLAPSGVALVVN